MKTYKPDLESALGWTLKNAFQCITNYWHWPEQCMYTPTGGTIAFLLYQNRKVKGFGDVQYTKNDWQ